jgi:hypothetical protein
MEVRGEATRSFRSVIAFITTVSVETPLAVSLKLLARTWRPRLAPFSFYTRDLAGGVLDVASSWYFVAGGRRR